MDLEYLVPHIRAILHRPDVDLTTISAKRVRKELVERVPNLDVRANKSEIDDLIISLFHELREEEKDDEDEPTMAALPTSQPHTNGISPTKRKRSTSFDDDVPASSPAFPISNNSRPPKQVKTQTMTDEEYAWALHAEMNNQRRSTISRTTNRKNGNSKGKKSSAYIDDSEDENAGSGANELSTKRKVKRTSRDPSRKTGFQKEYQLTPQLAAVVGGDVMSRPQVVKNLWEYIKGNGLQNPAKKTEILCDEALRSVMGVNKTTAFAMNKLIQRHIMPLPS